MENRCTGACGSQVTGAGGNTGVTAEQLGAAGSAMMGELVPGKEKGTH